MPQRRDGQRSSRTVARSSQAARDVPTDSFARRLMASLDDLEARYLDLLDRSAIRNVDPNRRGSGIVFVGASKWGWSPDAGLTGERTHLAAELDEWLSLFRLLHRDALPETEKRIGNASRLLRRWLLRDGRDTSIPPTVEQARDKAANAFVELRELIDMHASSSTGLVAVVDTNALLHLPDVADYRDVLGCDQFEVVLLPTVLSELDELKDRGRTADARDAATAVVRRIKGLRDRGNLRSGVPVEGKISLRAEHREVAPRGILDWLDPQVPDDRIIGATLDLQARYPSKTIVLVSRDINLQNKAAAVGIPIVDPSARSATP